ncbi:MAG: glycosyltransferase [Candidatus Peribacteraceae bacterium]|jgi:glycosyltransferase involved in cell wall biosynthesis
MMGKIAVLFGHFDQESPHTQTIRKDYEKRGCRIVLCRTKKQGFLRKYLDLIRQYRHEHSADTVVVMFLGYPFIPLAWLLTRFPRKRLIFDAFVSAYDTLVSDRKKVSPWNPYAWFLYLADIMSCHMADEIIVDTEEHRKFFAKHCRLNPKRIRVVYLEPRTDLFFPKKSPKTGNDFTVFFYGTYIPLQGIDTIIRAAKIVEEHDPAVHFLLVGNGQTKDDIQALAHALDVENVTFQNTLPLQELPDQIRSADLCLGIFGTSAKAQRVIPHKVYDAVACGVPIITEKSPAILERFADHPLVILCKAGDPQDLAQKILTFKKQHS